MRVLLLRPPRFVWPFNSETSAFWQPLGLLSLAAAVRQALPEVCIEVWDCPAEKVGWKTLRRRLAETPVDVLGIGEETVSAHEGLRAAAMVKQFHPDCLVVAGGTYYAHAIDQTLGGGVVDLIVRGEGERTFVEWLRRAHDRRRWGSIEGIAFGDRQQDEQPGDAQPLSPQPCDAQPFGLAAKQAGVVRTPHRALIDDLDELPTPAWDLVDMSAYGRGSRNHPALVSIEHSRGCVDRCSFCILWKHMGRTSGDGQVAPCYRTKSPQRSFEEVRELYHRFGRRTFGWVDPTFNGQADWSDGFAELMLGSELMDGRGRPRTLHTAWLRADGVVRDERLGILGKLVRAGLRQVMIGVERDDEAGLAWLDKHHNSLEICREAFAIFREKYPEVYTIGTMIFGLPGDTPADIDRLIRRQHELGMDYCFLMPLTPNPGTRVREEAAIAGRIANLDLASYNFHTPVLTTENMDLGALEATYYRVMFRPDRRRFGRMVRRMVLERDRRKRRVHLALLGRGTSIAVKSLFRRLTHSGNGRPALYSRKPSWYDR